MIITKATAPITPFTIDIAQSVLDDLQERLARTRWTDGVAEAGWSYGVDVAYLKELAEYWRTGYNWREHETALNRLPHFITTVDGTDIHFIHLRGKGPKPTPLILTHGWPDSFYRFDKVIAMLTDPEAHGGTPEDAFDVVVPSIPGFGFSQRRSLSSGAVADLWARLPSAMLSARQTVRTKEDSGARCSMCMFMRSLSL